MDITSEIKESLIDRIKNSNNLKLLKAIKTIFEISDSDTYELSEEQQISIQHSREEIIEGYGIAHDDVMKDLKSWLEKNNMVSESKKGIEVYFSIFQSKK